MIFVFVVSEAEASDNGWTVTARARHSSSFVNVFSAIIFGTVPSCSSFALFFFVLCSQKLSGGGELNQNQLPLIEEVTLNKLVDKRRAEKEDSFRISDDSKRNESVTLSNSDV